MAQKGQRLKKFLVILICGYDIMLRALGLNDDHDDNNDDNIILITKTDEIFWNDQQRSMCDANL
ncbi:hypothetical protein DERF_003918 [Dermatophagoides farinae]|uniref:Uncharacterized protein n=1 Tax=Dermatophagoides farinae TaxID=6954 RepID=A0A922LCS6_DERFA|nr:hypothetical protein DERF_003918 [Dermatophagoides farinae]